MLRRSAPTRREASEVVRWATLGVYAPSVTPATDFEALDHNKLVSAIISTKTRFPFYTTIGLRPAGMEWRDASCDRLPGLVQGEGDSLLEQDSLSMRTEHGLEAGAEGRRAFHERFAEIVRGTGLRASNPVRAQGGKGTEPVPTSRRKRRAARGASSVAEVQ